jgi:4-amino-4-deoxy-L-arabinose transferase-like glycosyltransferase
MSGANAKLAGNTRPDSTQNPANSIQSSAVSAGGKPWLWFLGLAIIFLAIESLVPLGSAIKLGADEDYELSKTLLFVKGFHFYTEVWIDQPPLYTFMLAEIVRLMGMSVLWMRLLTVGLALLLLGSLFRLCLNISNLRTAVLAVALVIAAPGFLELASSCMVEVPTLSFVVASLAVLSCAGGRRRLWFEVGAGLVFGFALQMKLIALPYLSLTVLLLWLQHRLNLKQLIVSALIIGGVAGLGYVLLNELTGLSLALQLRLQWESHFAHATSFEYGTPSEHKFDPMLLVRNWDVAVPAFACAGVLLARSRSRSLLLFPVGWLVLSLSVISTHRPWWACYYLHNVVPLGWCAAIAMDAALTWAGSRPGRIALVAVYLLGAGAWMGMRSYLEVESMRQSPRVFNSPLLAEIQRYKPYTQYLFTSEEVYTFHAGIPPPPHLAELSLKRLWSGDMTNAKIAAELAAVKPGLILIPNQTFELPYQDLLQTEYRMVYQDNEHQLYALKSVIKQAAR